MMYSTFSVRDAVKTACPELVDTIYRRAPYKSKEATDDAYIHIAGHDITSEQLVTAWNAANPKKEKIYAY